MATIFYRRLFIVSMMLGCVFSATAQTKIRDGSITGTSLFPNRDAIMELESTNRGLLLPRVELQSTQSPAPLGNFVAGMTVYNTATAGTGATAVFPGIYYNDGAKWVRVRSMPNWYKFGTTMPATNADSQYVMGTVAIGQDSADIVDAKGAAAKFTVAGGDASINGVVVGKGGGQINTNTAVGTSALYNNTTGYYNTATGYQALYNNTTAVNNTAYGYQALFRNTTGNFNIAIGSSALYSNRNTAYNIAIGNNALYNDTSGAQNVAIGSGALYNHFSGNNNTAVGIDALGNNRTGMSNVANGALALLNNTSGSNNVAVGVGALVNNVIGDSNTAIGGGASGGLKTGSFNTAIGNSAGNLRTKGDYNIVIGALQQFPDTAGSNQLNIGGAIFGTGLNGNMGSNGYPVPAGNIGINNVNPQAKLTVDNRNTTTPVLQLKAPFSGNTNDSILTWNNADSTVRKISTTALAKSGNAWFYVPASLINTTIGTNKTFSIYDSCVASFTPTTPATGGAVASASAPAFSTIQPLTGTKTDYYYYVLGYSPDIFNNLSIDASGLLTYDVVGEATDDTYINIVMIKK